MQSESQGKVFLPATVEAVATWKHLTKLLRRRHKEVESPFNKYYVNTHAMLGRGSQGCVFKAQDLKTQTFYAMKFTECKSSEARKESEYLFQLQSCPHICEIHESFEHVTKEEFGSKSERRKEYWCVVLKYYAQDLSKRIKEAKSRNSLTGKGWKDDELQIALWMLQLTKGLTAIHQLSLIHRDLKPDNIFLDQNEIKIGDFGSAIDQTTAHTFVGTMGYYAPETWKGKGYGSKADMYSLGSVLLDLLTLTFAPENETKNRSRISSIPREYSPKWRMIVESLLNEDIAKRYTAADLEPVIRELHGSSCANSTLSASDFETKHPSLLSLRLPTPRSSSSMTTTTSSSTSTHFCGLGSESMSKQESKYLEDGRDNKEVKRVESGFTAKRLQPRIVHFKAKTLVYRAVYQGKDVAVKVNYEENPTEISLMKKFKHPNVVKFIGSFQWKIEGKRRTNIVMEWAQEGDLEVFYTNNRTTSWIQRLSIAIDIAEGLKYLHHLVPSIIHCDLSSPNIGVRDDRSSFILDFGQSKRVPHRLQPNWMSPEMLSLETSPGIDIYSFGMILYELSTNERPLTAEEIIKNKTPPKIPVDRKAPAGYSDLMKECLAEEATKRPNSEECVKRLIKIYQREAQLEEKGLTSIARKPPPVLIQLSDLSTLKAWPLREKSLGFVYQAKYRQEDVAVKVFKSKPNYPLLFQIDHSCIESFIGESQDEKYYYLLSNYAQGTLQQKVTDQKIQLDWPKRLQIVLEIISALRYLHHHNIILRYLHPANILVRQDESVFLCNIFKTAKIMDDFSTRESLLDKTDPRYRAPEVLQQNESEIHTTLHTDTYGISMILYMLLTRQIPWQDKRQYQIQKILIENGRPTLPPPKSGFEIKLIGLIEDCWKMEPKTRPNLVDVEKRIQDMRCEDSHQSLNSS